MNLPSLPARHPESILWQSTNPSCRYSQDVCRATPGLLVILVDQSCHTTAVCRELSSAVNTCLQEMVITCATIDEIKPHLHVAVFGYMSGDHGSPIIEPALIGPLAGRELVSISDVAANPARIDNVTAYMQDEDTGEMAEMALGVPVWVDPVAKGEASLCAALVRACRIVDKWIPQFPDSFPPIVWNVTSGIFSDGDPWLYADALKARGTRDGQVLLFHTLFQTDPRQTLLVFPDISSPMPDRMTKKLLEAASAVPAQLRSIRRWGLENSESSRCLSINVSDPVIKFFTYVFDWDKSPWLR